jgi:hypothetical protein
MPNTATPEGRLKRMNELADTYKKSGNVVGLVNLTGGSTEDHTDHMNGYDDGEQRGADNFQ